MHLTLYLITSYYISSVIMEEQEIYYNGYICIPKTKRPESSSGWKHSNWVHVHTGLPQRTLLFLYINDLPKCISKQSTVCHITDDSIMYKMIKTIQNQIDFQKDLDKLNMWADK